jgi:hypothetical protein
MAHADGKTATSGQIRKQLIHLLRLYPVLSPTMIQSSLGGKVRPSVWRPIMESMIKEGTLVRNEVVSENSWGQFRSYTCIKLADNGS